MISIGQNLAAVRQRIALAARAAGRRESEIKLIAVSKGFAAGGIREAAVAGQTGFGESYLQESLEKMPLLSDLALSWHFIGPVQSNKTREVAGHFDWMHSVDRLKIAERLSAQRPASRGPLQVCVQVNVSGEASKAGCAPEDAMALCQAIARLPGLSLRGLMTIPAPWTGQGPAPTDPFRRLRLLFEAIRASGLPVDTISAGMSDDLESAIAEGATMVRVGTAIFGERS